MRMYSLTRKCVARLLVHIMDDCEWHRRWCIDDWHCTIRQVCACVCGVYSTCACACGACVCLSISIHVDDCMYTCSTYEQQSIP